MTRSHDGSEQRDRLALRVAISERARFEQAFGEAVVRGAPYPEAVGTDMLASLYWNAGAELRPAADHFIKYVLTEETFPLLPELTPHAGSWLDRHAPSWRCLAAKVPPAPKRPREVKGIAVLYESTPDRSFQDWAKAFQEQRFGSTYVDIFPGEETVKPDFIGRLFRDYQALVFFGHEDPANSGWVVAPGRSLSLNAFDQFLDRNPCELVFGGCCSLADRSHDLIYPAYFLDRGVRYVVGAWTKVWGQNMGQVRDLVLPLAIEFFRRWLETPSDAVNQLWQAKRALAPADQPGEFPLSASAFQIYSAPTEPLPDHATVRPAPAWLPPVVSAPTIPKYELLQQLSQDAFSTTYFATSARGSKKHLVQVLSRDWAPADTAVAASQAIAELAQLALSSHHLLPGRVEKLPLTGAVADSLLLVHDLPAEDEAASWQSLAAAAVRPRLVEVGRKLADLLAELHGKGLGHGNLSLACLFVWRGELVMSSVWLSKVRAGGLAAAPRRAQDHFKDDMAAFGAVLFELASGSAPPETVTGAGLRAALETARAPLSLAGLIEECLLPEAEQRPSAVEASRRLRLAGEFRDAALRWLETELHHRILAGQRLFAVTVDRKVHALPLLDGLIELGHHLTVVEEGQGASDRARRRQQALWQPVAQLPADIVAGENARRLIGGLVERVQAERSVVVLWGASWWQRGTDADALAVRRRLLSAEEDPASPAFLVIDSESAFDVDETLGRTFHWLRLPPLTPAETAAELTGAAVEAWCRAHGSSAPAGREALALGSSLYPCSRQELSQAVHSALAAFGTVDARLVRMLESDREGKLGANPGLDYVPREKLLSRCLGLPANLEATLDAWCRGLVAVQSIGLEVPVPRRLLVTGGSGYGKTSLAHFVATRLDCPIAKLDLAASLRAQLGDSERALRSSWQLLRELPAALILIEGVDRSLFEADATLSRLFSQLASWLDDLGSSSVMMLTSEQPSSDLPEPWRRRIQLELPLAAPGISELSMPSQDYRKAVFRAAFRNYGLVGDDGLMGELARGTHPELVADLRAPMAFVANHEALRQRRATLKTPADVSMWIEEHLLYSGGHADPEQPVFWRKKLELPTWHD